MNIDVLLKLAKGYSVNNTKNSIYCDVKKLVHYQELVLEDGSKYYLLVNRDCRLLSLTIKGITYYSTDKYLLLSHPITQILEKKLSRSIIYDRFTDEYLSSLKEFTTFISIDNSPYFTDKFLSYLKSISFSRMSYEEGYLFKYYLKDEVLSSFNTPYNSSDNVYLPLKDSDQKLVFKDCLFCDNYIYTNNIDYISSKLTNFISSHKNEIAKLQSKRNLMKHYSLDSRQYFELKYCCEKLGIPVNDDSFSYLLKLKGKYNVK